MSSPYTILLPAGRPRTVVIERAIASVWAHLYLARAINALLVFAATALGAALAGVPNLRGAPVFFVALSNALLAAGSTAINDWHDADADAINRPERPIPSGHVRPRRALLFSALCFAAALAGAATAGPEFAAQAAGIVAVSVAYTFVVKGVPLFGNMVAAFVWAYPLWCWIGRAANADSAYFPAIGGFVLMGIGQEILNAVVDARGDEATGVRTVATTWGVRNATRLGAGLMAAVIAAGWTPVGRAIVTPAFTVVLAAASVAFFGFAVPQALMDPGAAVSRRIVQLGRVTVIMLALAMAWDLGRS